MSQTTGNATPRTSVFDHPMGFWFFFWGEFAERCCYYGMRAILLLYMIQILDFSDGMASAVMSYYIAACYLLPLVGGHVADNYLGKYRTIVYFSVPYIIGQVILGISSLHNESFLFLSLGLLAMGSGVIKPNISTLMGLTYDQRRPGQTKLRSDAFAMFYGAINIGAALSSFAVPAIRNYYGGDSRAYAIAFLFPAGLMILAFLVFASGKSFYAVEKIERKQSSPEERRQRLTVLGRLLGLFLVVMVFWAVFDQSVSTWTLFARDHLHLELFGWPLSPDQLQTVNPMLIVVLLAPITMLWHFLSRIGFDLKPTSKMLIGFVLTGITMAIIAWAGYRAEGTAKAHASNALDKARQTVEAAIALTHGQPIGPSVEAAIDAARVSVDASRVALDAAQQEGDVPAGAQEAVERAEKAAKDAADAVKKSQESRRSGDEHAADDIAGASAAANRAAAAASSAKKAIEAAKVRNREAAEVNAAVAALASTDATALAARAAAKARSQETPPIVFDAEAAAAAGRVSILWQVIPYLLITIAEICISVVGLELAFAAAPATMKSFVTACWLSVVFLANVLINAQLTPFYNTVILPGSLNIYMSPGLYFGLFAAAMVPVTLAFALIARRFNRAAG